mmetsp:Transcript_14605/g.40135  ORF Transcript_14605/g.40135 Transcript_14605/m.40135 type:complete len:283 (+) Transcript_14605:702-1550(+)
MFWIASLDSLISVRFRSSSCNWSMKVVNWSMAFLFTCSNLDRAFVVLPSSFMIWVTDMSLYLAISEETMVRLLNFSSASPFFLTRLLIFTTTSSKRVLHCAMFSCNCWSCTTRPSSSDFRWLSPASSSASLAPDAASVAATSSCSRSCLARVFARACTSSSLSCCESRSRSDWSSCNRFLRNSCKCCSWPRILRCSWWHLSLTTSMSLSAAFSSLDRDFNLACCSGVNSSCICVFISASIASMAADTSAMPLWISSRRSTCRRAASRCLETETSNSWTASAA